MNGETLAAAMREAMAHLHWDLRDLFVSAFGYGMVGNESDVGRHLVTGSHLTCAQSSVLVATLNDALIAIGDPFRVVCPAT